MKNIIDFLKNPLYKYRINKYVKKWNSDIPYINECIAEDKLYLETHGMAEKSDRYFYWKQLVTQEIEMYIKINKKVTTDDFVWLCKRRGFTINEQSYLHYMLQYLRLT